MMRRTCLPSTLRLTPVIHELTSVNSSPSLAARNVVGPGNGAVGSGLDAGQPALVGEADQASHPVGGVFDGARKVAEPGMRAHHHQKIGKPVHQDPEKGLRPVAPFVLQRRPVHPADIDTVEGAGDRIEAGGIDDDVELVFGVGGLDGTVNLSHRVS